MQPGMMGGVYLCILYNPFIIFICIRNGRNALYDESNDEPINGNDGWYGHDESNDDGWYVPVYN